MISTSWLSIFSNIPDSKVHGANMGPTWVRSTPGGPHVVPMNLAIRDSYWCPDDDTSSHHIYPVILEYSSISSRQDPGEPHGGPMNFALWVILPTDINTWLLAPSDIVFDMSCEFSHHFIPRDSCSSNVPVSWVILSNLIHLMISECVLFSFRLKDTVI